MGAASMDYAQRDAEKNLAAGCVVEVVAVLDLHREVAPRLHVEPLVVHLQHLMWFRDTFSM